MSPEEKDIRWEQRYSNFNKAYLQLIKFIAKGNLNELEVQGLIQSFEYTYELSWKTLKDYLEYQGITDITGSRDTIRKAFQANLIEDGESWMDMLVSRNKTSHTYDEKIALEVKAEILNKYVSLFQKLDTKLSSLKL